MEEEIKPVNTPKIPEIDVRIFACLSYVSVLFIVPWIIKRDDSYVMFHVKQGLTLFLAEAVVWVALELIGAFFTVIFPFGALTLMLWLNKLAWLAFFAVSVVGIYYAGKGELKQLPILYILSKNLKI